MDDGCFSEVCTVQGRTNDVIRVDSIIYSRGLEKKNNGREIPRNTSFFSSSSFFQLPLHFSRNMLFGRYQLIILPLVKSNYKEVAKEGIIFSRTYDEVVAVAERA